MIKKSIILTVLLFPFIISAQHTFSITAVDTVTGQVGAAGASCIDINNSYNINRINELVPGRGAINAQAWWQFTNLANAKTRMKRGDSPEEIIEWLKANDDDGRPDRMQYVIADISGENRPRSAAFTGSSAMNWAGHRTGHTYAVAGNILIGSQTVERIETEYLQATGTLAERLMAALQGANFAGADRRCEDEGVSSLSAFIRVALPTDPDGDYYCDLNVPETPYGVEPIDELQKLFDEWNDTATALVPGHRTGPVGPLFSLSNRSGIVTMTFQNTIPDNIEIVNFLGKRIAHKAETRKNTMVLDLSHAGNGIYLIHLYKNNMKLGTRKLSLVK